MPTPSTPAPDRRTALRAIALGAAALLTGTIPQALTAQSIDGTHPEPRPGITGAKVLTDAAPRHRDAYEAARQIPEIVDGIRCHCDCADRRDLRSLLSCFETDMPKSCGICLGSARTALRLHRDGKSLAEIRRAIDLSYGPRRASTHQHG